MNFHLENNWYPDPFPGLLQGHREDSSKKFLDPNEETIRNILAK